MPADASDHRPARPQGVPSPDAFEKTTLPDVLQRVRAALLPDRELNLFARYPTYAARSDRLAMAMKRGEPGSLQAFVKLHIPLARKSSRVLIRWFDMDPEDAEQTAMIGLLEAARRFDPDRGYQFSTYAGYWIRNACQRYGLEWGLPMHVPAHLFWECYKLEFAEARLLAAHGKHEARTRLEMEIDEAGVSREQWRHYQLARRFTRFSEIDRRQQAALDLCERSPSTAIEETAAKHVVERALEALEARQAWILKLRYGIGHPECTLQQIAERLDLTRERVRQIQVAAEEKMTRVLRRNDRSGEFRSFSKDAENAEAPDKADSLVAGQSV